KRRRGLQRKEVREQQPANNRYAQRSPQFGTGAALQGQRQGPEQRRHRRHHDRSEPQQAGLVNGFFGRQFLFQLRVQRKINHHDRVLLDDADQQNNSDQRDQGKVITAQNQRQQ